MRLWIRICHTAVKLLAGNIERADHFGNSNAAYNQIASEGTDSVLKYMDKKSGKTSGISLKVGASGSLSVQTGAPGIVKFATGQSINAKISANTSLGRDITNRKMITIDQFGADVYKDMRGISSDTSLNSSQRAVKMQKYLEGLGESGASFAETKGALDEGVIPSSNMKLNVNVGKDSPPPASQGDPVNISSWEKYAKK